MAQLQEGNDPKSRHPTECASADHEELFWTGMGSHVNFFPFRLTHDVSYLGRALNRLELIRGRLGTAKPWLSHPRRSHSIRIHGSGFVE